MNKIWNKSGTAKVPKPTLLCSYTASGACLPTCGNHVNGEWHRSSADALQAAGTQRPPRRRRGLTQTDGTRTTAAHRGHKRPSCAPRARAEASGHRRVRVRTWARRGDLSSGVSSVRCDVSSHLRFKAQTGQDTRPYASCRRAQLPP